jgi:magnesium chelatase family protein
MLFKTQSAAVYGIYANIIEVEVDVSPSRDPKEDFQTVGLADTAVKEKGRAFARSVLSGFKEKTSRAGRRIVLLCVSSYCSVLE